MSINYEPVATRLMIDIKHQPDAVLVDIRYQTRASPAPGGQGELRRRARATCSIPAPLWAGEALATPERSGPPVGRKNRPRARAACATPATGGQGGLRLRIRAACVPPVPAWKGGSGRLPEHRVRPRP